jgi:inorganic pyrophosphatase
MGEPLHCLVEIPKGSRNAMVCVSEPTFSGCLIPVAAIAVFRMTDDKGQDDKILCVPHEEVVVDGWYERDVALRIIEESRVRWREKRS